MNRKVSNLTPVATRVIEELLEAIGAFNHRLPPRDAICHKGVTAQSRCARCQRIARLLLAENSARNLLEGEKLSPPMFLGETHHADNS